MVSGRALFTAAGGGVVPDGASRRPSAGAALVRLVWCGVFFNGLRIFGKLKSAIVKERPFQNVNGHIGLRTSGMLNLELEQASDNSRFLS